MGGKNGGAWEAWLFIGSVGDTVGKQGGGVEALGLVRGGQHTERHGRRVRVHLHVGDV